MSALNRSESGSVRLEALFILIILSPGLIPANEKLFYYISANASIPGVRYRLMRLLMKSLTTKRLILPERKSLTDNLRALITALVI